MGKCHEPGEAGWLLLPGASIGHPSVLRDRTRQTLNDLRRTLLQPDHSDQSDQWSIAPGRGFSWEATRTKSTPRIV